MKQHVEPTQYLDITDVQEGDILNFVFGHRWYFGKVEMIHKELFIVLLTNHDTKFRLKLCSHLQRLKGGTNMGKTINKVPATKATKATKVVKVAKPVVLKLDVEGLSVKVFNFMKDDLKITEKSGQLKVNRAVWELIRDK